MKNWKVTRICGSSGGASDRLSMTVHVEANGISMDKAGNALSALPELVKALQMLVDEADETEGHKRTVTRYSVDKARAALAKVEG